jgi:hypothetical protein
VESRRTREPCVGFVRLPGRQNLVKKSSQEGTTLLVRQVGRERRRQCRDATPTREIRVAPLEGHESLRRRDGEEARRFTEYRLKLGRKVIDYGVLLIGLNKVDLVDQHEKVRALFTDVEKELSFGFTERRLDARNEQNCVGARQKLVRCRAVLLPGRAHARRVNEEQATTKKRVW